MNGKVIINMKKNNDKKIKKTIGQSLVEYGLILSLVAIVLITVLDRMGQTWKNVVNTITGRIQYANQMSEQGSGP